MSTERGTFVFADIAGFSALTEAHGDERAAESAAHFAEHVHALLKRHGGDHVKSIGDEVMLRLADAGAAVRLSLDLAHHEMGRPEHPAVRVGMHCGQAVERDGDWFGATVNLAARVAQLASSGEVLLTEPTRHAAGDIPDVLFEHHGEHRLRNVREPVRVVRAVCDDERPQLVIDPVCRIALAPAEAAQRVRYEGIDYCFCSAACLETFRADPRPFVADPPP